VKINIHFRSCLAQFILKWGMFQAKGLEKNQNKLLMFNKGLVYYKSCCLRDNVEKYCRAGHATDDNMAHAYCILYNLDYKHTLRICNTYYSSTAAMVALTRISVTFYVHACLLESIIRINFTLQILPIYVRFTLLSSVFFFLRNVVMF
jgi:hypothetical protein